MTLDALFSLTTIYTCGEVISVSMQPDGSFPHESTALEGLLLLGVDSLGMLGTPESGSFSRPLEGPSGLFLLYSVISLFLFFF